MLFFILLALPLLEIAGFIVIGGYIGLWWSLLWVVGAAIAGVYFLTTMGLKTLNQARQTVNNESYPFAELFDGLCILLGAVMLIVPGFISDLLAIPLLVPSCRRALFRFLKDEHQDMFNSLGSKTQGFTSWYYQSSGDSKTIDGEFIHVESKAITIEKK